MPRKTIKQPCIVCGKERFVRIVHNKPRSVMCRSCSALNARENSPDKPNWKGGITIWGGYVFIYKPDHPKALNGKYVKRSVLVLEAKLSRYLRDGYDCHHIDDNKLNDSPENLEEKRHDMHASIRKERRGNGTEVD